MGWLWAHRNLPYQLPSGYCTQVSWCGPGSTYNGTWSSVVDVIWKCMSQEKCTLKDSGSEDTDSVNVLRQTYIPKIPATGHLILQPFHSLYQTINVCCVCLRLFCIHVHYCSLSFVVENNIERTTLVFFGLLGSKLPVF